MTSKSFSIAPGHAAPHRLRTATAILLALFGFCAFCVLLLILPISVPIGPMYWDTFIYYDGINRVLDGQIPAIDFEAPVGALNYYLAALMHLVFPHGQPLLLIHFSFLVVSVPLVAVIGLQAARQSAMAAWGVVLPFLFFAALPFDTIDVYPFPGVDGFGYYNRHAAALMYLASASVFFIPKRRVQSAVLAVIMLALFFSKVTAFFSIGLVLAFGLLAGLIAPITALTVASVFVAALGLAEWSTGIVSAYLHDILFLVAENQGGLLPRFLTALSLRFDVAVAGGLLVVVLAASQFRSRWPAPLHVNGRVLSRTLQRTADNDWLAIGICLLAGLVFETQNTGSHAYLLVWPPMLRMLLRLRGATVAHRTAILVLVALATLPTLTKTGHRAARAAISGVGYDQLQTRNLGTLGRVTAREQFLRRADLLREFYPTAELPHMMADRGEWLSALTPSEPDFQLLWLKTADEAIDAIRSLEDQRGRRFDTIFTLDFTNPFPFLLDRHGPRGVAIGADPSRTVPDMGDLARTALSGPGLVLLPTCPDMIARRRLYDIYAPALRGHERIRLTQCYDAFLK
ncbi:hypothetical protein [Hoeflea marina]|nr:hypothetical protein [Hoeflea marina]